MISNKSGSNKLKISIIISYISCIIEFYLANFIASFLNISKEQPIFFFFSFLTIGFTELIFFRSIASLIETKFPTMYRLIKYLPTIAYTGGVILTFINMFIPFLSSYEARLKKGSTKQCRALFIYSLYFPPSFRYTETNKTIS